MNEKMSGNRLQKLSPMILRLGLAAALALHGSRQFTSAGAGGGADSAIGENVVPGSIDGAAVADAPTAVVPPAPEFNLQETLPGTPANLVSANRIQVVAGAEILAAVLLLLGFLTRLTSVGILGASGYAGLMPHFGPSEGVLTQIGQFLPEAAEPTLVLLAVVSAALLMSGCGGLGVDARMLRRKQQNDLTTP